MRLENYEMTYAEALKMMWRHELIDGVEMMKRAERNAVEREEYPAEGYTRFKFSDGSEIFV